MVKTKFRVLIVEDEVLIADDLRAILEHSGHVVVDIVATGEQAVELAANLRPDAILMDISLKGPMNGVQAAVEIQSPGGPVPVIFVSAHRPEEFPELNRVRCWQYLPKPCDELDLAACLDRVNQ